MFIWIYETLEMIEKSQKKIGEYTYKITKAKKNVSLQLRGKLK